MAASIRDAFEKALRQKATREAPVSEGAQSTSSKHQSLLQCEADRPVPQRQLPYTIKISKQASFALDLQIPQLATHSPRAEDFGHTLQVHRDFLVDEREVTLGLDFGTSCVKVVFGDRALGKAFAVPFQKSVGVQQFLLPSRVFQAESRYSIEGGARVHRDLKLSLLAAPDDVGAQRRVVAFLALVIRRARGWLLTEHEAVYRHSRIHWRMSLGLPTRQGLDSVTSDLFRRLGLAAWRVAGMEGRVAEALIDRALDDISLGVTDVEVDVIPEIAAQIYGFVASNSFDKKASNIYLMADVGSGTVDASLFYVKPGKGARWNFSFFTSVVEPIGVTNLHRHRVGWWQRALKEFHASEALLEPLRRSLNVADQDLTVPNQFEDYYQGIDVRMESGAHKSPDKEFFSRVLAHVRGRAFHEALDRQVPAVQMSKVPFFLCGGGSRMKFYGQLEPGLAHIPNFPSLSAKRAQLQVPNDLVAAGMAPSDYDRLSVAYGLSRLESGSIVEAEPLGELGVSPARSWEGNYVDKDQC